MPISAQQSDTKLPIACVNIDYILQHYSYAKELNEALKQTIDSSKAIIDRKNSDYEKELKTFQNRIEEGDFLSEKRAQTEYERIKIMGTSLEELMNKQKKDMDDERARTNSLIEEAIINEIKEYNQKKKYQVIYNKSGGLSNILYANEEYDITSDFEEFINQRHESSVTKNK